MYLQSKIYEVFFLTFFTEGEFERPILGKHLNGLHLFFRVLIALSQNGLTVCDIQNYMRENFEVQSLHDW